MFVEENTLNVNVTRIRKRLTEVDARFLIDHKLCKKLGIGLNIEFKKGKGTTVNIVFPISNLHLKNKSDFRGIPEIN